MIDLRRYRYVYSIYNNALFGEYIYRLFTPPHPPPLLRSAQHKLPCTQMYPASKTRKTKKKPTACEFGYLFTVTDNCFFCTMLLFTRLVEYTYQDTDIHMYVCMCVCVLLLSLLRLHPSVHPSIHPSKQSRKKVGEEKKEQEKNTTHSLAHSLKYRL